MIVRRLLPSVALAGVVAALTGCDAGDGQPSTTEQVWQEASSIPFTAVRTFKEFKGGVIQGSYTERFHHAANGDHAVELEKLGGLPFAQLLAADQNEFVRLQEWMKDGFGRYIARMRDVSIQDQELFEQNYTYTVLSETEVVAGRPARLAEIRPVFPDRPNYLVWTDQTTFVVLKSLEFLASGALVSEMTTESIEYGADHSQVTFPDHSAFVQAEEIDESEVPQHASFNLYMPVYLPAGFEPRPIRTGYVHGHKFLSWTWSDGVIELMLIQYAALQPGEEKPEHYPPNAPVSVRVADYGSMLDAWFFVEGTQVHFMSKLSSDEFSTVIESIMQH